MLEVSIVFVATAASMVSCTVKEEREECPCYLQIDLNEATETIADAPDDVLVSVYCPETFYRENIIVSNHPDYLEIPVPRGDMILSVISARDLNSMSGKNFMISDGKQADSIYAFSSGINAASEYAYSKVTLHKQYSTVYLKFTGSGPSSSEGVDIASIDLRIKGRTCGIRTDILAPCVGDFSIDLPSTAFGQTQVFRIPRQADKSLCVELYERNRGEFIDSIALGEYIDACGYSWNAEDLDDIFIEIDYAMTEVKVSVRDWEEGKSFNEII